MSVIINSYSFGGYTARTLAFLAATGISDTTIANALNTMDLALIANGIDTKMKALYPFVGGTATTHKFNFMNPADTDAAFRLTFIGGWTHSANGALSNGTTGTVNTHLNPSVNLSLNSSHLSFYDRLDKNSATWDCIAGVNSGSDVFEIVRYLGDLYYAVNSAQILATAGLSTKGNYIASRTSSSQMQMFYNLITQNTSATPSVSLQNKNIYYASYNEGASFFATMQLAFATLGDGLSSIDANNLYNAIQAFQTSLSRNV